MKQEYQNLILMCIKSRNGELCQFDDCKLFNQCFPKYEQEIKG
jgi:hypothetical protein